MYGCQGGSGTVELRANGSTGTLLDSIVITVNPPTPTSTPPAVSNLTTTASPTSVRLSWKKLDGATKYRVEHRLATSTDAWTPVDTTANARSVTNLMPDTSYAFKIRAYGDGVTYVADWGAEAATTVSTVSTEDTVALAKPPAPAGLGASAPSQTAGRVTLTWSRLTGADKYEVEYRRSGSAQGQDGGAQGRSAGNWVSHDDEITGPGPTITHHVDGLTCGQEHDFRVQSHGDPATALFLDDWGEQWSTVSETPQCGTTPPTPTPTPRPTTLDTPGNFRSILGPGAGEITLIWDAVVGATRYEVQQKRGRLFPLPDEWKPLPFDDFAVTTTGAQAVVGGLKNDKSYDHRVRAVNADGKSGWTAELTTDLSERRKPVGLTSSVEPDSIGEITLQWGAVAEPSRYEVQQKSQGPLVGLLRLVR